ncbi:MAG: gliding motility-associated C-terminal domain-containing protein [Saprospiraceae bacterium]|nr:gliding motility-associated C-terminal domain-containing protein [Saprospiraceae bacterium]MCF8252419.1 gliding motility-associated C-terminal domain-containing protein [Saprospiraceae bacterium]MCF8280711.1 gliding motility-associated C-terminal domain-containing protein [Bacteroidales bacterium]MCF8314013.1 gliding motility-associated C-terminal domain-containing protein [Saprospiraceae bacterium]MCF8442749.1 gliding motility-associated C-terminal domain-containing protein [Saprospiraceae 
MRFLTLVFTLFSFINLHAQIGEDLVSHISFNQNGCAVEDEAGDPAIQLFVNGDDACGCGVNGNARFFDGNDDWFYLFGQRVEETFSTIDFSLSFYFKPTTNSAANQALFSKKVGCTSDASFVIRFNAANRSLSVELTESSTVTASITKNLPESCWYHVVVVRKGATTTLYVNKAKLGEVNAPGNLRVNISNSEPLTIGSSDCNLNEDFHGYIDEVRLYSRAISIQDVQDLYLAPNQIKTGLKATGVNDTTIFLGEAVAIHLTQTCANTFDWSPPTNVVDFNLPNPIITPSETTTYTLEMTDNENCVSKDSIRIVVVDPTTVECGDILLPSAFTPNGDGLNDRFGISNPFATGELLSFEIFDRWGNIVFQTNETFGKWDGFYKGQAVSPGVFLYKIRYRCEGNEKVSSGSVTVLR